MDVKAMPKEELMKYAFDLKVPTRRKRADGQKVRRSLKDVRAECLETQLRTGIPDVWKRKASRPFLIDVNIMRKDELMRFAFDLRVPTRRKKEDGQKVRRALRDVRADCLEVQARTRKLNRSKRSASPRHNDLIKTEVVCAGSVRY